jgi:hypothetical protein
VCFAIVGDLDDLEVELVGEFQDLFRKKLALSNVHLSLHISIQCCCKTRRDQDDSEAELFDEFEVIFRRIE